MEIIGDKQIQEAGEGATQIQSGVINVNVVGIDEKRAREIVDERVSALMSQYSQEAHETAKARIKEFADDLIPRLVEQKLLESLADPGIQVLLQEAQKSAASTEREGDKMILSELLVHRIRRGENRHVRAGVSQAIRIVDEISDEALLGLTVAHAVGSYLPVCSTLAEGLKILDSLFEKLLYGQLPISGTWLEDLYVLNATRFLALRSMKKIKDLYSERMPGLIDIGIPAKSKEYGQAVNMLNAAKLQNDLLVPHELRGGYVRLRIVNIDKLDSVASTVNISFGGQNDLIFTIPAILHLIDEQKQALRDVYELYEKDDNKLKENKDRFMERWNSYQSLRTVGEWWDSIDGAFSITSVGRALAQANAKRCDPKLPDLDLA